MAVVDDDLAQVGAVLVEERVLRRVIKLHRHIAGFGLQVPHEHCYWLRRDELRGLVEAHDVGVDFAKLPERVVVLSLEREDAASARPEVQSHVWRTIFHARIHEAFEDRLASKAITTGVIRERVNRVGQTEFDEIRSVLRQEELLLPPVDEVSTYIEFAALYLELQYFSPRFLERTFPALLDRSSASLRDAARPGTAGAFDANHIAATLALDVDAEAILAASRPPRAPAKPVVEEPRLVDEHAQVASDPVIDPSARGAASKARVKGNRSRAAVLSARAGDMESAKRDLEELCARLGKALGGVEPVGWADALLPVARYAAGQRLLRFTAGSRLLYDLQAACVVAEREIKVVDAAAWAISRGRRPLVRALPATREVRVAKHLHAAVDKIAGCGLASATERERLSEVVHAMSAHAEDNVRRVLRPKIEAALESVALSPHNIPERVAQKKVVDELLDQAVAVGRLSIGNLRDALSHNDLKMNDLELHDFKSGDQLLRCDKTLSTSLDGVYRRGEAYLRGLQKISSILFGTRIGRFLSLYLMLPLLGSLTVFQGLEHTVGLLIHKVAHEHVEIATVHGYLGLPLGTRELVFAAFLFGMLHVRPFRRGVDFLLRRVVWRLVRLLLWDIPSAIWRHPITQAIVDSVVTRWVLKPAIPAAIVALAVPDPLGWPLAAATFVVFEIVFNSRFGRIAEEMAADFVVRSVRKFASRFVPGLIKWLLSIFVELIELLDRAIYRVDEFLRFKQGESRVMLVVKGALGALWFLISYFLRLYINLFVEPTINPIKHFPVVTVAAKIIVPIIPQMYETLANIYSPLMGTWLGGGFATISVIVIPGFAGFLVWEFKENWKLYRATRALELKQVMIGHHGETMLAFLRPGFHSGTIPKLYTKLRRAAWKNDERNVAKYKEGLHHVEEAIYKFADRELVALLREAKAFRAPDVAVGHVTIGSNRVQIEIVCPSISSRSTTVRFEHQSGWMVADLAQRGWVDTLDDLQLRIFVTALAGFYKQSGVDIVREQVEQALQGSDKVTPAYDIADEGMLVWPGQSYEVEAVYDLESPNLKPIVRGGPAVVEPPVIAGRHALFGREPVHWSKWATAWAQIARSEAPMAIVLGPPLVPLHSATSAAPAGKANGKITAA